MKQPIRNERLEIVGYVERWSAKREILRDKNQNKIGTYERDTGVTRDDKMNIVGYKANQLLRLLKR